MIDISSILPAPKNANPYKDVEDANMVWKTTTAEPKRACPAYGQRKGFIPRSLEDFGDGGAFPEIHVAQYPLNMGKKGKENGQTLALTTDGTGSVKYDVVSTQGQRAGKKVFSKFSDLVEKRDEGLQRPSEDDEAELTAKTKAALEKIVNAKVAATHAAHIPKQEQEAPTYIRYTPANQGNGHNSGSRNRIIRMVELPKDPLEPAKFKGKRTAKGPPSPPPPIMHSPPRKVTAKDMQDWKVPPCISNWKNPKGYTIPLDKRLAADGRGQQEVVINDRFAEVSEALYIAERNSRDELEARGRFEEEIRRKQKEAEEERLSQLADAARQRGTASTKTSSGKGERERERERGREERDAENDSEEETDDQRQERVKREKLAEERRRELEYERRKKNKDKNKRNRDDDRDISEVIALGQAAPNVANDSIYDARLFNSTAGMGSGLEHDDVYNVYDKPLFSGSSASQIYKPRKSEGETYGEEQVEAITKADKFTKGDRAEKTEKTTRDGPVQYERERTDAEDDPFGLGQILNEVKSGGQNRKPLDKIGTKGHMSASGGSNYRDEDSYRSAKRTKIDFEGQKSRR